MAGARVGPGQVDRTRTPSTRSTRSGPPPGVDGLLGLERARHRASARLPGRPRDHRRGRGHRLGSGRACVPAPAEDRSAPGRGLRDHTPRRATMAWSRSAAASAPSGACSAAAARASRGRGRGAARGAAGGVARGGAALGPGAASPGGVPGFLDWPGAERDLARPGAAMPLGDALLTPRVRPGAEALLPATGAFRRWTARAARGVAGRATVRAWLAASATDSPSAAVAAGVCPRVVAAGRAGVPSASLSSSTAIPAPPTVPAATAPITATLATTPEPAAPTPAAPSTPALRAVDGTAGSRMAIWARWRRTSSRKAAHAGHARRWWRKRPRRRAPPRSVESSCLDLLAGGRPRVTALHQSAACPEHDPLHLLGLAAEDAGDLLVREVTQLEQDQGGALLLGEVGQVVDELV